MSASIAFAGGPPMAIGEAQAAFAKTIAANQVSIAAFLALPCVSDSGKTFVTGLQAGTTQAQTSAQTEYKNYMAFVTKPMQGNGKCDGGFQGVEAESARRRDRSQLASQKIHDIETAYHDQAVANPSSPVIIYNNTGGDSCTDTASALYDALAAQTGTVQNGLNQVVQSLQYEAAKFNDFEAQNAALRAHCGESSSGQSLVQSGSAQGAGGRAPASVGIQGNSSDDDSTITGIKENEAKKAQGASP